MTTITAQSVLASRSPLGVRVDSLLLEYPRWIHAEGRTHRLLNLAEIEVEEARTPSVMEDKALSRNASSSRAIPVKKMIADMRANPAVPIFWGANQKGMQADEECSELVVHPHSGLPMTNEKAWLAAMEDAIDYALAFEASGYHKQIVNRLLEPFTHIRVLVTATEWSNFFALRIHSMAEPHIRLLAERMQDAMQKALVQELAWGEWHTPFVPRMAIPDQLETGIKLSVARCARLSYLTTEMKAPTIAEDMMLYHRLVGGVPLHASPAEHQCTPDATNDDGSWSSPDLHGNLKGMIQYRKTLMNEAF